MSPGAVGGAPASKDLSQKKRKLLDDSDSDSDDGGAALQSNGFKVNEEFARRFEHNKKREEKHRLEEKFKKEGRQDAQDDEQSSSDETEDEEGFLATEDLDAQISATLNALRNKDPRVYNKDATFYEGGDDALETSTKDKKEKPVFLRDYQREKILRGDVGASDDEDGAPQTYVQEQDALKKSIVSEINAAGDDDADSGDGSGDDFIQKKKGKEVERLDTNGLHPSRSHAVKVSDLDVANANRDPETFLSNFMAARAWVSGDGPKWEAFESDDGEDDGKADEWEQAYNMRFEDPEKSNEVLRSYARDVTNARSVRREDKSGRKRHRELEKDRKEEERRQRKEEKTRLRKLKLDEAEEKLKKIKQAAGAVGKELTDRDWVTFLDEAWEDDKWEEEMQRRFGEDYYATHDAEFKSESEDGADDGGEKKKPKKPKWDDDIDIKDIIPDFEDENAKPGISLTDEEEADHGGGAEGDDDDEEEESSSKKRKTTKDHKRQRLESQKQARRDRSKLEALVDSKLALTDPDVLASNPPPGPSSGFRYRETSPQTFGMTARDILLAPSDKALNEFAGLKKLATFRDDEKKRRDRKKLGKKARLRQWRKEQFGHEFERTGPTYGFEKYAATAGEGEPAEGRTMELDDDGADGNVKGDVGDRKKKRKRSKGKKAQTVDEAT